MARTARQKSESNIYHVMLRGINKQQIFNDNEDCQKFLQVLYKCKEISKFNLYAYCLMGNHIHLLIQETDEPLSLIMKRITTRFVYWYNTKYNRIGHLFQDRYKSEPVDNDEYFFTVIRYIHQNPIKAGICKNISLYRYSSYNNYFNDFSLIDYNFVLDIMSKEEFVKFNNEYSDNGCLDIETKIPVRVTDEQAERIFAQISMCKNSDEFKKLKTSEKEYLYAVFRKNGLSIRQISRLTG